MQTRTFQRRIESFHCAQCGAAVQGDGYTNHCPHCLWSRHVDIHPGDRAADCGGMMEPRSIEYRGGQFTITHHCSACPHVRRNRAAPNDSREALFALVHK